MWSNVAQLAADELLASGRHKEFWYLLGNFCRPLLKDGQSAGAALLAVQIAEKRELFKLCIPPEPEFDEEEWLSVARKSWPLFREAAMIILLDHQRFTPERRDLARPAAG